MSLPFVASTIHSSSDPYRASGKPVTLPDEERKAIIAVFQESDNGRKGYLTREDIKVAMVSLFGYKPSKYEVDELLTNTCLHTVKGDVQGLTLEVFLEVMSSKMAAVDEDEETRQTFLAFDSQCRGFSTIEDLKKVFSKVAPHLQTHRIEAVFREVDRDGDGRVSYKDFEFMMKYNTDDGF